MPQHPYRILFRSPQDLEPAAKVGSAIYGGLPHLHFSEGPPGIMKDPVKPPKCTERL